MSHDDHMDSHPRSTDAPQAWADDVPLRGEGVPKNDGTIKHLIEYLLTVYERFGNTCVTADLQWGATALHKRDKQKERIAELEAEVAALRAAPPSNEGLAKYIGDKRPENTSPWPQPSSDARAVARNDALDEAAAYVETRELLFARCRSGAKEVDDIKQYLVRGIRGLKRAVQNDTGDTKELGAGGSAEPHEVGANRKTADAAGASNIAHPALITELRQFSCKLVDSENRELIQHAADVLEIALRADGGTAKVPEACEHGVRWPHDCVDCERALARRLDKLGAEPIVRGLLALFDGEGNFREQFEDQASALLEDAESWLAAAPSPVSQEERK